MKSENACMNKCVDLRRFRRGYSVLQHLFVFDWKHEDTVYFSQVCMLNCDIAVVHRTLFSSSLLLKTTLHECHDHCIHQTCPIVIFLYLPEWKCKGLMMWEHWFNKTRWNNPAKCIQWRWNTWIGRRTGISVVVTEWTKLITLISETIHIRNLIFVYSVSKHGTSYMLPTYLYH